MTDRDATSVVGRLVLDDEVADGTITIEAGLIAAVELGPARTPDGPFISPGFVDVHVHGWGGHDAMGGRAALDGMARRLLRHGVTSFLPTAVTAPLAELVDFAGSVRDWAPDAPADGAGPLGFNLEGPFLARARRRPRPAYLQVPADVPRATLEPLLEGLRLATIAPSCRAPRISSAGSRTARGDLDRPFARDLEQARAGYAAGARSTTHLFNAMTGSTTMPRAWPSPPCSTTRCSSS
jgi:N-acetylglucosamine-6-phosphate deacetylase